MRWTPVFCLLLVMCSTTAALSQNSRFGLGYRYGYLLAHHQELRDNYGGLMPQALEFNWLRATNGDKQWQRVWNYPDIGISFGWIDLKDPDLGHTLYSTVYLQKYIRSRDDKLQFSFKVAPGISYSTKTFEPESNENNTFVSTRINLIMEGNFLVHYRLAPQWNLYGGIALTHYSNGGVKLPNSGFNIPSLTLGAIYRPAETEPVRNGDPVTPIIRSLRVNIMYAGSFKSEGESTNDLAFAWTLSGYGYWRMNHRSALTGGLDVFYNGTIPARVDNPDANPYRLAVMAGHDLIAGPTSILFQVGYYVYRPEDVDKSFYWRIGVKQHISKKIFAAMLLKAHMGRADVIEWGLGYQL